jgi:lysozyme
MQHSKTLDQLTESFEGCELKAYQDGGRVWTIGYGHTYGVTQGMTCTLSQAEQWLDSDYRTAENAVNFYVKPQLSQPEFDALVDFVFNVGVGRFKGSTMLTLINQSQLYLAALEFDKWGLVKGQICAGILRRRQAETALFEEGVTDGNTSA